MIDTKVLVNDQSIKQAVKYYARKVFIPNYDSEDIEQELWLTVIKAVQTKYESGDILPFVKSVLYSEAGNLKTKGTHTRRLDFIDVDTVPTHKYTVDLVDTLTLDTIETVLKEKSKTVRMYTLAVKYVQLARLGNSNKYISESLGISYTYLRKIIQRIKPYISERVTITYPY